MLDGNSGTGKTVLVVDDHPGVCQLLVAILEQAHFRVLSALEPLTAIQLAEATDESIDLLLSDINMPFMSGNELGDVLEATRPGMKVMLMSGQDCGSYGRAFIRKPFVTQKLLEMVAGILSLQANGSGAGPDDADKCALA